MPEIFLSYNREDASVAKLFADGFAREGLEVWWDQTLRSGEAYDEVTEAALRGAGAVVVLWSPHSVASRWVRAEASIAGENGTMAPVKIAACDLPVMFRLTQTADLSHWRGKAGDPVWLAFLGDVRRMLGREAAERGARLGGLPSREPETAGGRRGWTRRAMALGLAGAGGAAAIAYGGWSWLGRHEPDPRAVELYRRGQAIQREGVPESMGQAIEAYKQAVAIDPRYAEAWGALALGYRYPVVLGPTAPSDPQQVREAAERALALDPRIGDARLALITLKPSFRHWQEREEKLRGLLRDHRDSALGHVMLTDVLLNVGRFDDAVTVAERATGIDPARKNVWYMRALAYYLAGRHGDGDMAMEQLQSRWPQDAQMYANGYFFILWSKRYSEAIAYLRDTSRRPRLIRPGQAESWMRQADVLATGRGIAEVQNMLRTQPAAVRIQNLGLGAIVMALLGMVDELFALLEAYYFGGEVEGTRVPPPGPLDYRITGVLFNPALAGLRGDSRFGSLLERTGLEDYWRKSGTQPDFRRSR